MWLCLSRPRVVVEQSYFHPFLPQSRAEILPVQRSWGIFMCHGGISQRAGARGEMSSRMAGADRRARGGLVFTFSCGQELCPTFPTAWTDAKSIFPSKSMQMWCLGNGLVVCLGFDGLKGHRIPDVFPAGRSSISHGQSLQPVFPPAPDPQIRLLSLQAHLRFVHFNIYMHVSSASIIPNSLPKNILPPYLHGNSASQFVFTLNPTNIFISHKSKSLLKPLSNHYLKQIFSNLNPSLHNDQSH